MLLSHSRPTRPDAHSCSPSHKRSCTGVYRKRQRHGGLSGGRKLSRKESFAYPSYERGFSWIPIKPATTPVARHRYQERGNTYLLIRQESPAAFLEKTRRMHPLNLSGFVTINHSLFSIPPILEPRPCLSTAKLYFLA
jgi:hypothetical protein